MLKLNVNSIKYLLVVFTLIVSFDSDAQKRKKKGKNQDTTEESQPEKTKNKSPFKEYSEVITDEAKTDEGLFKVHLVDDAYYYEIPDSLLGREMLMVTRIAKTASGIGFGGGKTNTQVLRWERKHKNVLLRIVSYSVYAADSLPIHEAVVNSNFAPILGSFKIETFGADSSLVVNITDLFTKDVKTLGLPDFRRKSYKVTRLDNSRSYIESLKSYPLNIESRHVKTYFASSPPSNTAEGSISVEMNNSMILLPKEPMRRRYFDERVGWFARGQTDYGLEAQESKTVRYLDRWRLEIKEGDLEKFNRGELVEPKKPIVYYVDRATPEKWRPYIKQGIEDWQVAFEEAGFKNAIIAMDPPSPEVDPEWSPEDVRYSVVRYLASPIPNANGPHVSDPRSGEILESDINWYHNVMTLLRNWFFIQTAVINPDARGVEFRDEIMGRLIRFVSAHEVGHTLGLPHNMGASSSFPVDSLRSASFTQQYGPAPSIMDYARFNYVAQPGDEGVALMPDIGVYDKHSIRWGYRPIPEAETAIDEKPTLDKWITDHADDPMYRFGRQQFPVIDPSAQTEDLGDDAVKASNYGIANLKRIVPNLIEWTSEDGKNYDDLGTMYGQVLSQFNRYMGHVSNNIGGVYQYSKTYDQEGPVFVHVAQSRQKESMDFMQTELFATPSWMIDKEIFSRIEFDGSVERIRGIQTRYMNNILDFGRMARMIENETLNGNEAYSLDAMMGDMRRGIWSELRRGNQIDTYRRNLQRSYLERMEYLMTEEQGSFRFGSPTRVNVSQSDIRPIVRANLNILRRDIVNNRSRMSGVSRYHLDDAIERIDKILDPN